MKTIIFDFGNVIGLFDHNATLGKLAPFTDLSPREMFLSVYNGPLEDEVEVGKLSPDAFLAIVHQQWRLKCEMSFLRETLRDIFTPNHEVCALIPKLRGKYRLLLGSNTNSLHADRFRVQFSDVLKHLDHLVLSHEIGTRKPRLDFFHHCVEQAHCEPGECLFIDDLSTNIESARTAGMRGIVYRPNGELAAELKEFGVIWE